MSIKQWIVKEKFAGADIYEVKARSLLNKATGFISAYDFTLNPYRGCQYGCSYCYAAAFSPDPELRQSWGDWVVVKENAVEILGKELARWHRKRPHHTPSIYLSSVTDPYQPLEAKQKLTRELLKVMLDYQPTLVIQTRSPMIARDIDLLGQFERLRINMSIPTGSESVRQDFEPRSPSIKARLQAMGKLRHSIACDANHDIRFSITLTPLLPTFPEHEQEFINKLTVVDRVVIQEFHASNSNFLVATTRQEAIALKNKYSWWYEHERESYQQFKQKLIGQFSALLADVEVKEGKEGFSYD